MERIKNVLIVVLSIAFLLSMVKCNENKNKAFKTTNALTDTTKYFKNKLGTETASKLVLETDLKTFKRLYLEKDDSLKQLSKEFSRVKSVIKYKTITKIDTVNVVFKDSIPCVFEKVGNYKQKHLSFGYNLNNKNFSLNDIQIPNETTVINGFKRKWIFGRQTMTTDITHSNELIKTTEIKTIEIKVPKRIDETRLFNIGVGIGLGYFIFK